jgi:cereblon
LKFGILSEILSISFQDPGNQQQSNNANSILDLIGGVILKVKGRDRFEILKLRKEVNNTYIANVKILPELRFNVNPLFKSLPVQMETSCQVYLSEVPKENSKSLQCKIEYFNSSHMPAWMLRKYDCNYIMNVIKKELHRGFGLVCNQDAGNDPQIFSSWLLNNFPFDNKMRSHSLKISCLNQRLLYIHSLLKKFSEIVCTSCGVSLCSKVDIFSISKQGYMSPFLNPGGVIHETLTVYKIKNCSMVRMPPCAQHSWFPGYGWQICNCANCGNHIGWKFTSMSSNLKPEKFWGLTRKSIRYELSNSAS